MNDFTKEELEDLQSCVRHYTWGDGKKWDEPLYPHLVNKIQSMIEVYDRYQDSECSMKVQVCDE